MDLGTGTANGFDSQDTKLLLSGVHITFLCNTKNDTFWWKTDSFKTPFNQDEARVGDIFYDGNNGDKHEVLAVGDRDNRRLLYRNLDQLEHLTQLAVWDTPFESNYIEESVLIDMSQPEAERFKAKARAMHQEMYKDMAEAKKEGK